MGPHAITIIIPTTLEHARHDSILEAIESVLSQEVNNASIDLVIVVNGSRYDKLLFEKLNNRSDLRLVYLEQGSLPLALRVGREAVRGTFFGFLDDDDIYLPGTIQLRLDALRRNQSAALAVCNGYVAINGNDQLLMTNAEAVRRDPLLAMHEGNWLASCGALYRSSMVSPDDFDSSVSAIEWTHLAYRLVLRHPIVVLDQPGFKIHETVGSLSRTPSAASASQLVVALQKTLALPIRRSDVRRHLRKRLAAAHHDLSVHMLAQSRMGSAWLHHAKSLMLSRSFLYLSYTRHLLTTQRG